MKGDENDIRELIRRARGGDREAFDEIVATFGERVESVVRSRLGVELKANLDVEDVLQETFTRAFESLGRFEWEGEGAMHRWLCTIAEHVILEAARSVRKRPKLQLFPDVPGSAASPSTAMRRDERFERLERALDHLSPDHRQVILLSRIERLKIREIARRMDRSPDAVKQLLSRALRKLKESFGDTESLGLPDRRLQAGERTDPER